jgi:Ca2+-dependent lipid-binding protein
MATPSHCLEDAQLGVLEVMVMSAKDLKKRYHLITMDPRVLVKVGFQKRSTRVHKNGGTDPVWNERVRFAINIENEIDLEILDGEHLIGKCSLGLSKVRKEGKDGVEATVYCKQGVEVRGTICVKLTFTESENPKEGSMRNIAGVSDRLALAFNVGMNDRLSLPKKVGPLTTE